MRKNLYKVKDHNDILKDRSSGAILFNDREAADEYLTKRSMFKKNKDLDDELNTLKEKVSQIDELRSTVNEIRDLLRGLVK